MRTILSFVVLAGASLSASAQGDRIPVEVSSGPGGQVGSGGPILAAPPPVLVAPGLGPALGTNRITQDDITGGSLTLKDIRRAGRNIFSTPFNHFDGHGDGRTNPADTTTPGGRPTMQNNGTFLRVNGLDSQSCLECHGVLSNREVPSTFAVGGVAGIGGTAMPGPTEVDIDDSDGNGFAFYNGRLINPPFLWGAGGVELVAKEMTLELQQRKADAQASPGDVVALTAKGVDFGTISYDFGSDTFDTSNVEGVDADLVVRPFGRKGNNGSIRKFDLGALPFHQGMQPEELVDDMNGDGIPDPGVDNDADGDGVVNEILVGELSALHIFTVSTDQPRETMANHPQVVAGRSHFQSAGCAECHVMEFETDRITVPVAFPELETDPTANVFIEIDLHQEANFPLTGQGGIFVRMFSDLKRHDMGPELAESTGDPLAAQFITPRLWGIADTAPYLHDGRALTLSDAITMHGGEGQGAADAFALLNPTQQSDLLVFLDSLRTPRLPDGDL